MSDPELRNTTKEGRDETTGPISETGYANLKLALPRLSKAQLGEIARMCRGLLEVARPEEADFERALQGFLLHYRDGEVDQLRLRRKVISQLAEGGSPTGADDYRERSFKTWTVDDFKVLSGKIETYFKDMVVDDVLFAAIVANMRDIYSEYRKRLLEQWDKWVQDGDQKKIDDFFPGFKVPDVAKLVAGVHAKAGEFDRHEKGFRAAVLDEQKLSTGEMQVAALKDIAGRQNLYSAAKAWLDDSADHTISEAHSMVAYFKGMSEDELRQWVHFAEGGS